VRLERPVPRPPSPIPAPIRPIESEDIAALETLYAHLDREIARLGPICEACGRCCHLEREGHELWLTDLELAYLIRVAGPPPRGRPGVCPYLDGERCAAREARALGCRVYHCRMDRSEREILYEEFFGRLRETAARSGRDLRYGELLASLEVLYGAGQGRSASARE